jgi:DNA (cytosine-5)-methyltransferase 1
VLRTHATATSATGDSLDTVTTGNHHYLTVPPSFYTMQYSGEDGREPTRMARSTGEPLGAQTASNSHGLVWPPDPAFLVQNYGNNDPNNLAKHISDPFGPITTKDHHALVLPYQRGEAKSSGEPFSTMMANDSFALVQPENLRDVDLDELVAMCHYRMLMPRESLNAQRFDPDYLVTGNIGEQTMQAGNAVSCNVAQWLGERVYAALNSKVGAR